MIVFQAMWMNTRQYITIEPAEIVSSFSISHKHRGPSAIVIFTSKSIEKKNAHNTSINPTNSNFRRIKITTDKKKYWAPLSEEKEPLEGGSHFLFN